MKTTHTLELNDKLPFGKHKDKTFSELMKSREWGYILWINEILFQNYKKDTTKARIKIDSSIIEKCSIDFRSLKGYYWEFKNTAPKYVTEGDLAMQEIDSEIYQAYNC